MAKCGPVHDAARVAALLDVRLTSKQLTRFGPPPQAAPGFVTFFDLGWSIGHLCESLADKGKVFHALAWLETEPFAKLEETPRFRQVRMRGGARDDWKDLSGTTGTPRCARGSAARAGRLSWRGCPLPGLGPAPVSDDSSPVSRHGRGRLPCVRRRFRPRRLRGQ